MSNDSKNARTINDLSTISPFTGKSHGLDSRQFLPLKPGRRLGEFQNYRLEKQLGQGGMGQTWLAEELAGAEVIQKVVVKVLSREFCGNAAAVAELRREFEFAKRLRHSNICTAHGMKRDPAFGWLLLMDYADGGTLSDWHSRQAFSTPAQHLEKVLEVLRPIASALDFAHSRGIIHRDVKPQNILFKLEPYGPPTPCLIDFGIAFSTVPPQKADAPTPFGKDLPLAKMPENENVSPVPASDSELSFSGTPQYMAPEQLCGRPQDARTDQYSLAVVVYELLADRLPFMEKNPIALGVAKSTELPPEIQNFSSAVNSVIRKALASQPEERFSSCMEFIETLKEFIPSAESPSQPTQETEARTQAETETEAETETDSNSAAKTSAKTQPKRPAVSKAACRRNSSQRKTGRSSTPRTFTLWTYQSSSTSASSPHAGSADSSSSASTVNSASSLTPKYKYLRCAGILAVVLLCVIGAALRNREMEKRRCFSYVKEQGYIEIEGWQYRSSKLSIPSKIEGLPVRTLKSAPAIPGVEHITLPKELEKVTNGFFSTCSALKQIEVSSKNPHFCTVDGVLFSKDKTELVACPPNLPTEKYSIPQTVVKIGSFAFAKCAKLTSIEIPETVREIGSGAFYECENLKEIQLPPEITQISPCLFEKCRQLENLTVPAKVVQIGKDAFHDCAKLTSVTLPEGLQSIKSSAFFGCERLKNLTLPQTLTHVGGLNIFGCTKVPAEEIFEAHPNFSVLDGVLFNQSKTLLIDCPFKWGKFSYTVPEGVEIIGENAFYLERSTYVHLPSTLKEIRSSAFAYSKINEIVLPKGTQKIGPFAFHASSLRKITIPETVTEIAPDAFIPNSDIRIYGKFGSYAEKYAEEHNFNFEEIEE